MSNHQCQNADHCGQCCSESGHEYVPPSWKSTKEKRLDAADQLEQRSKSFLERHHASPESLKAAERLGHGTKDFINRNIPDTSPQDEEYLKRGLFNRIGTSWMGLTGAVGGMGLNFAIDALKPPTKYPKPPQWLVRFAILPVIGTIIGTVIQRRQTSKAIAESSSKSELANKIRNEMNKDNRSDHKK